MPNQVAKQLSLDYVESGKIFHYQRKSSDFVPLDCSDLTLRNKIFRDVYLPDIGNYAAKNGLRFAGKTGEFGSYSAMLHTSRFFPGDLLFIQVQQRTELDYLYRQPGFSPIRDLPNRPYTQAHITVIPAKVLLDYLQENIAIYDALLFRTSNGFALKDYGIVDAQGHQVMPAVIARSISPRPLLLSDEDLSIAKGVTNKLYETWLASGTMLPNIVIVTPGVILERRLAIMQEIQSHILPILGIVTFALDYAIPPESQIYFCEQLPDQSFPLGKSKFFTYADVLNASKDGQGFYQASFREGLPRLSEPKALKYLRKRLSLQDSMVLLDALKDAFIKDERKLFDVILRNYGNIEPEDTKDLFNLLTQDPTQLLNFIRQIPRYSLQANVRKEIFQVLFVDLLNKLPESMGMFLDTYVTVREQDNDSVQFRPLLQYLLKTQPEALPVIIERGQADLIYDLFELNLTQTVEYDLLAGIFIKPTHALFEAINQLHKNGKWNEKLQIALIDAAAKPTTQWSDKDVERLYTSTPIRIPELPAQRLLQLLNSEQSLTELSRLPDASKAETFRLKILGAIGKKSDVFQAIPSSHHAKLREVALSICYSNSVGNLRFTREWLGQIGKTTVLSDNEFWADFKTICNQFRSSQPLSLSDPEERALYDLLKGRINPESGSIAQALTKVGIQNRTGAILQGLLLDNQSLPRRDIEWIIDNLPATNSIANCVIDRAYQSTDFMSSLLNLGEAACAKWLSVTRRAKTRVIYNSRDILHETLFRIYNPSQKYILDLATEDEGMFVGVSDWRAFSTKLEQLLTARPAIVEPQPVVARFRKIVNEFQGNDEDPRQLVREIRLLSQLSSQAIEPNNLPELSTLTLLLKRAMPLASETTFATSYTTLLMNIAEKVSVQVLVNAYNPLLLYCCWDYLLNHLPSATETNNFFRACESVYPAELASVK